MSPYVHMKVAWIWGLSLVSKLSGIYGPSFPIQRLRSLRCMEWPLLASNPSVIWRCLTCVRSRSLWSWCRWALGKVDPTAYCVRSTCLLWFSPKYGSSLNSSYSLLASGLDHPSWCPYSYHWLRGVNLWGWLCVWQLQTCAFVFVFPFYL